jgi:ferritin-like metal-binding protein YciE
MGIIEEGQEVMKTFKGMPALDAGLLAAARAVEHYEIARYGSLKTWAAELGLKESGDLLGLFERVGRDSAYMSRWPALRS